PPRSMRSPSATAPVAVQARVWKPAMSAPAGGAPQKLDASTSPASASWGKPRAFDRVYALSKASTRSNSALPPTRSKWVWEVATDVVEVGVGVDHGDGQAGEPLDHGTYRHEPDAGVEQQRAVAPEHEVRDRLLELARLDEGVDPVRDAVDLEPVARDRHALERGVGGARELVAPAARGRGGRSRRPARPRGGPPGRPAGTRPTPHTPPPPP